MRTIRRAAVAFALLLSANSLFAQTVTLRYRWTKGEEVRYQFTLKNTTSMSMPQGVPGVPGSMALDQTITETIRIVVDDVAADGVVTLRETIESMRAERTMPNLPGAPQGKTIFDTANGDVATTPDQLALAAGVGKTITLVMAPSGAVLKVEGMTQLLDDLTKGLSQSIPAAAAALNPIRENFSDQALAAMQGFAPFPDRPLKPGDTWDRQRSINMPIGGKMATTETLTLQKIEGNLAYIKISGTTKPDGAATLPPGLPANLPMQMHLDDTAADGELQIDVAKGRIQRTSMNTTGGATMTMTLPVPNAPTTNMTMSMKITMAMVMELLP